MVHKPNPTKKSELNFSWGKPTKKIIPIKPRNKPINPKRSIFSIFINLPITEENNGIAPTNIAVKAVPILGTATDKPINWIDTEVTPSIAKCLAPIEKSNFFLIIKPSKNTQPLAMNALTEIAAAQSNACTTRSSNKKDTPQSMERMENFVAISAFI